MDKGYARAANQRTTTDSQATLAILRDCAEQKARNRIATEIEETRTEGHIHNYCDRANPHEPI